MCASGCCTAATFPFPPYPGLRDKIGWLKALQLQLLENLLQQDYQLKEALGIGRDAERAYRFFVKKER